MKKMNLVMEGWRKYLKEDLLKEQLVQEVQALIDQNQFLKGKKLTAKDEDLIQGKSFVLVLPDASIGHIKERHTDGTKPGSLLSPNIDLKTVAEKVIDMNPSEQADGRVKWLGVNVGSAIGAMGVAKTSAEEIKSMTDYQMPDGKKEMVKITAGKRKPTSELSLITAELGALSDGKKALSLITMFPGGMEVDGTTIPADRSQFAQNGLYFPVDANSPLLQKQAVPNAPSQQQVKESKMKITKQYLKRIIKEELEKVMNENNDSAINNEIIKKLDGSFIGDYDQKMIEGPEEMEKAKSLANSSTKDFLTKYATYIQEKDQSRIPSIFYSREFSDVEGFVEYFMRQVVPEIQSNLKHGEVADADAQGYHTGNY